MNFLITGATGFIGRHFVEELSKKNKGKIFCLVRNPQKAERLKSFGVENIYGDIVSQAGFAEIKTKKIDVIFHCAAHVEDKNRRMLYNVNVRGTENICALALGCNVERLVYVSSVSVVSGHWDVPLREDLPYKATNLYGESKIEAEKKVLAFREKGLRCVVIRPPMVYGEEEPHALPLLLSLIKHRLLPLINNGKNKMHLGYVKNIAEALIFSLTSDAMLKETFFAADEEVLTVKELFTLFAQSINASLPWQIPQGMTPLFLHTPFLNKKLSFFLKDRVYSIEKITSAGFNPLYQARPSIIKTCQSFCPGQNPHS